VGCGACSIWRAAAGLVIASVVVGAVHSRLTPITLTLPAPEQSAPATAPAATATGAGGAAAVPAAAATESAAWMVHTEEAKALYERAQSLGDVFFVDARNADEHGAGHIPGSYHVPPDAFYGGQYPAALEEIPKSSRVVVYCGGGACDASKLVALRFREAGFGDVVVYQDGFTGWSAAGLPQQGGAPAGVGGAGGGGGGG
jgi:rhodanese-related sulfurtransferase